MAVSRLLMKDKSGRLVSVPKDRLEAFAKAQRSSKELTPEERERSSKELTPEERERRVREISQKLGMK